MLKGYSWIFKKLQHETFEKNDNFLKHSTGADQYFLYKTLCAQSHPLVLLTVFGISLNIQFLASIHFASIGTSIKT